MCIMDTLPEFLINKIHKYKHEMLYYRVMKQSQTYRLHTVFIVSVEFLEYGYYEPHCVRIPSNNNDNINATSQEILCLISNDRNTISYRWSWPYGGVL